MFATQNVYPQVRGELNTSSRMRTRMRALPYVYIRMYACTRMSVCYCLALRMRTKTRGAVHAKHFLLHIHAGTNVQGTPRCKSIRR